MSLYARRHPDGRATVRVWDLAQRVGHWALVGSFATAWVLSEGERLRQWHVMAGLVAVGVALWRLGWGLFGSRHALFSDFVRGPGAVARYLRSLLDRPEHHLGHNPAGGWAIVLLLTLTLATGITGWLGQNELSSWAEKLHEPLAKAWMLVVAVHVMGVVTGSMLHAENLVVAMLHGRKPAASVFGSPRDAQPVQTALVPVSARAQDVIGLLTLGATVAIIVWTGLVGLPRWLDL